MYTEVGHIKEIWRYPIKSMAGEPLKEAHMGWYGLEGDRRAAFVRADTTSVFPWLTGRQVPELVQYQPVYTDETNIAHSPVVVKTPNGRTLPLDDPDLRAELAQAYGHDISLIRIQHGIYDSLNVSVMSTATAQALDESMTFDLDYRRFRQNIIIETFDQQPFAEENWIGQIVMLGAVQLRLNERIPRCQMVNIDPDTAVRDPRVLKMVAQTRDVCVGVGCTPATTGIVHVGDIVQIRRG